MDTPPDALADTSPQTHCLVTYDKLELEHYLALVTEPRYGAVASFFGTVRSPNAGQGVRYIDYEGYEAMIRTQMEVVVQELRSELELGHFVLAHRLGRCYPGEASIALVASSAHRKPALLACQKGIDRAKDLLPVWKLEVTEDGSAWVEGSSSAGKTL